MQSATPRPAGASLSSGPRKLAPSARLCLILAGVTLVAAVPWTVALAFLTDRLRLDRLSYILGTGLAVPTMVAALRTWREVGASGGALGGRVWVTLAAFVAMFAGAAAGFIGWMLAHFAG